MALTVTEGFTWANGNTVMPTRLNNLVRHLTIQMAASKLLGTTGAGNATEIAYTATGLALLQAADEAAARTAIGADALDGSGGALFAVLEADLLKLSVNGGYATSGAIALNLTVGTSQRIELTGNATFTASGQAAGIEIRLALKNTTGGSITLAWPAWTVVAGVTLPTSLAAGATIIVRLACYGTTTADVVATLN